MDNSMSLSVIENTIKHVRAVLTNDLVDSGWKEKNREVNLIEHSAHVVEAIFFLLGRSKSGLIPCYRINDDGSKSWWLEDSNGYIFDPTFDSSKCCIQSNDYQKHASAYNLIDHSRISRKARIIIERYNEAIKVGS